MILLSVPHGHPTNDLIAPAVAYAMADHLEHAGHEVVVLVNFVDRHTVADANREPGRILPFRERLADIIAVERPQLLIDVHSYPAGCPDYPGQPDFAFLETPGLTDRGFLEALVARYATEAAGRASVVIQPARARDDVLIHARELGQAAGTVALIEHRDNGNVDLYAEIAAGALVSYLRDD